MGNKCFKMCIAECNYNNNKDININTNMPYVGISLREQYKRKREVFNDQLDKFNKIESMVDDIYKVVIEEHIDISDIKYESESQTEIIEEQPELIKSDMQNIIITVEINNKIKFRILVDK